MHPAQHAKRDKRQNAVKNEHIVKQYTLFDDLMEKGIVPNKLANIPENIDYINYLRRTGLYNYLTDADENILETRYIINP